MNRYTDIALGTACSRDLLLGDRFIAGSKDLLLGDRFIAGSRDLLLGDRFIAGSRDLLLGGSPLARNLDGPNAYYILGVRGSIFGRTNE